MRKLLKSLYFQVIIAIIIGVLIGHYYPKVGESLKPLGDGFIKLVKMIIAPLIFCTVVLGIAGMQNVKKVGKVGLTAIIYFEVMTSIALLLGMAIVNILQPGTGMNIDPASLDTSSVESYITESKHQDSLKDFLLHIIPDNVIGALAQGDLLQVLFFAILLGFGLSKIGKAAEPVMTVLQSFLNGIFAVIKIIMRAAPIGALGAMGFTIGKYGLNSLTQLGMLMLCFYLTCLIFIFLIIGAVLYFNGFSVWKVLKYIKEELLIVLGTSSSESALPGIMQKLERAGCSKPVVGLVIPTGYSFNLDGTSIYLTMAAIFIAQALNMHMNFNQQLTLLLVLLLTSKGAAGVTGSGFIILAATLPMVGHVPVESVALVFGIDRFMSEARALTNIIGNTAATLVIAKWEKEIDLEQAVEIQR
ncbi:MULTISPECIES: dicarboxylate/amino acid:cation symporter [Olivibacter]|jgi:aerobic C4-dicarboxylate transport protein|uniref:Sodium:dicarboxylate symporter n=4 Tax=Sphingobacteriaceae TaxID=84566 RepID=F4CE35_SPHS2|nr:MULTISPECIES: dicarboxylate/amino acid:cation symporter [Olivibacter]MCL4637482.1 dicarboxylate/amino acid:cation symporter [Olivibacter sp. UJ_SKK_5.1]MDM8177385.1 dicarboxylate/amino acid:cation symporter [Olivibacter sp. 47]MDX3912101.1 dicarboxylate/amino acid:cation symporter [Pseudosphingobacterium sp.]QEK99829.1 dicarboxylate/amino acid:cation symporter [Olivibacter sp. LS-1]